MEVPTTMAAQAAHSAIQLQLNFPSLTSILKTTFDG